jgi:malate synthase
VVPVLNARFVLNAANARWGSLYDALYGTDAIPGERRRRAMIRRVGARDRAGAGVPGRGGAAGRGPQPWRCRQLSGAGGRAGAGARRSGALVGYRGEADAPSAVLLRHHGLHIELVIDRTHRIGRDDPAGLADVVLEAALTTIVDLEDSVARSMPRTRSRPTPTGWA